MADETFVLPSLPAISPSTTPLRYVTKSELVYQYVRKEIVTGALAPGERLYLEKIARQLEVSTNPVRDAFCRLETEGLITNRPHVGAVVATINIADIETHFLIRSVLEGLAARFAAMKVTSPELDRLESLHRHLDQLAAQQDFHAWDEYNLTFYQLLFRLSRASELVALIDLQRDRSPRYRYFPDVLRQRAQETSEGRRQLLDALRNGDGEAADQLQRANVVRAGTLLCLAMRHSRDASSWQDDAHSHERGGESARA